MYESIGQQFVKEGLSLLFTYHNATAEQSFMVASIRNHLRYNGFTAGTLPIQSHLVRIASESPDIFVDPLEGKTFWNGLSSVSIRKENVKSRFTVVQAKVGNSRFFHLLAGQKPKSTDSIIKRYIKNGLIEFSRASDDLSAIRDSRISIHKPASIDPLLTDEDELNRNIQNRISLIFTTTTGRFAVPEIPAGLTTFK